MVKQYIQKIWQRHRFKNENRHDFKFTTMSLRMVVQSFHVKHLYLKLFATYVVKDCLMLKVLLLLQLAIVSIDTRYVFLEIELVELFERHQTKMKVIL